MIGSRLRSAITFSKYKKLFDKYERVLVPGTLVLGVVVDFITFRTIQITTAFIVLGFYFLLAGFTIAFMHLYDARKSSAVGTRLGYLRLASPLLIQFTFGALLSASLIFYWFSSSLGVSWPLIIVIALLMASNDVYKRYYLRLEIQIFVYFFILFSQLSIILPFILRSIESKIFVISGLVSLFVVFLYVQLLGRYIQNIRYRRSGIQFGIVLIWATMNMLYFANIIPPIPLSLTSAGIYHSVERIDGKYYVTSEPESLVDSLLPGQTVHLHDGDKLYAFASIFSPADLDLTVYHRWEYYDRESYRWVTKSRPSYKVTGGRADGYRGYSFTSNVTPGSWRVDVETERGQTIGRVKFKVIEVDGEIKLIDTIK